MLNHENIKSNTERMSKVRPFINSYKWKEINFPSKSKDSKRIEINNKTIAFNVLFPPNNKEKIRQAYISKRNLKRENQVVLLMIANCKKLH